MKINISIEATPEEIREAMGLPDLRVFHEEIMKDLQKKLKAAQDPKELMKIVFPAGGGVGKMLWEQTIKNMNLMRPDTPATRENEETTDKNTKP